ncbi:MAG: peptidoglycan-binding protein [Rhizobiaceae bacterium]|nr:peptidoglycan-binding protein [Rhizobiaceae bacterium]MCV0405543.1 peptidoglycan-binding protein [Rhizobiaceae bacterium]
MASVLAKKGYAGSYVESVQRRLNKALTHLSLVPDGKFGTNTENAVIEYQNKFHLIPDGIVGAFTDAVLFERSYSRLVRRPDEVYQASPLNCWAAATESWLSTRGDRRKWTQEQLIEGLKEDGGARADGALKIPAGETLWQSYVGLRPIAKAASEFFAETAANRMSANGPLMVGYKPAGGAVGHVEVMWGTTIHKGEPAVVTMDPLRKASHMKVIRISELHAMSGRVTTWMPAVPTLH